MKTKSATTHQRLYWDNGDQQVLNIWCSSQRAPAGSQHPVPTLPHELTITTLRGIYLSQAPGSGHRTRPRGFVGFLVNVRFRAVPVNVRTHANM